jgi:hypothetical protein
VRFRFRLRRHLNLFLNLHEVGEVWIRGRSRTFSFCNTDHPTAEDKVHRVNPTAELESPHMVRCSRLKYDILRQCLGNLALWEASSHQV